MRYLGVAAIVVFCLGLLTTIVGTSTPSLPMIGAGALLLLIGLSLTMVKLLMEGPEYHNPSWRNDL